MSDRVRGPEIAGVDLDGAPTVRLGDGKVAGLLIGERAAGEYRCIARDVLRPRRHHTLDGIDHVLWAAEPEVDEVRETEGNDIVRIGAQDRLPHGDRTIELALAPGSQRGDVTALARSGLGGKRLRGARLLDGDRDDRLLEGEHREIAPHAMRQREVRIGLQHGVETIRRIGPESEVAGDEMIEGRSSLCACGRDGEAACIAMRGVVPSSTWVQDDSPTTGVRRECHAPR